MEKRGFLLAEETLKIILAVISIGVLVYLLAALYNPGQESQEMQFAESSLEHLISEADAGSQEITIYNPEGWWLANGDDEEVCICDGTDYGYCSERGICKESEFSLEEDIELENLPIILEINQQSKLISKS